MAYISHMLGLNIKFKKHPTISATEDPPRYPPFMKGLPAATPNRLLSDHDVLVKQIFQAVRATNKEYKTLYLPLMTQYASFVHLLPASESHHHRGAGGLLRHGLEVAFWALQQCENAIYALESHPEVRRQATLRWEFAVFTAGLCHDVGKCVSDMAVTDRSGKAEWNPFEETLYEWLSKRKIDRYHIRWRDARHGRHEKIGPLVLDRVLQQQGRAYLAETGPDPLECMISALNGSLSGGTENQVYTMINKADRASVEHDLKNQPLDSDSVGHVATPVIMSLFDAMRRLVKLKTWTVNTNGSRVWFIDGRIFLVWPAAAKDITSQLDRDSVPGIPKDSDTIADILFDRELAIPYHKVQGEPLRRYWQIAPDVLGAKGKQVRLMVLELTNPSSLLDPVPKSVEGLILDPITEEKQQKEAASQQQREAQRQPSSAPLSLVPTEAPDAQEPPIPDQEPVRENPLGTDRHASTKKTKSSELPGAPEPPTPPEDIDLIDIFQPEFDKQRSLDLFPDPTPPQGEQPEPAAQDSQKTGGDLDVPQIREIESVDEGLFLSDQSMAGEVIHALADDLKTSQRRWQYDVFLNKDDLVAIPYPDVLGAFGLAAEEILAGLKEQDWIETDPLNPMLSCMKVDNFRSLKNGRHLSRKAILLSRAASATFVLLSGTTPEQIHESQKVPAPSSKSDKGMPDQSKQNQELKQSETKAPPTPKKRTRKKRPPNPQKQTQKACLMAAGAKIVVEGEQESTVPVPLKDRVRSALLSSRLDLEWQENETYIDAPLEDVCNALMVVLSKDAPVTKEEIIGVTRQLGPGISLDKGSRTRRLVVEKEQIDVT